MKKFLAALVVLCSSATAPPALASCTCFIPPKRDFVSGQQKLTNSGSKVVIARDDGRTVMTVSNDYKGEIQEFAMVVPVPTFIEKGQINVADRALLDRMDAFTSPRLTEIQELNPCDNGWGGNMVAARGMEDAASEGKSRGGGSLAKTLGVNVEAEYAVGEYDIVILSAEQSDGLETWLKRNDYAIPAGASKVFSSYIKQGMKFFVAKVNLEKANKLGFSFLRPLQIAYESPKFMLPIRLGMINATGPQNLTVFTLTRRGRVEPTNYRIVRMPTNLQVPHYINRDFGAFYEAAFDRQVTKENMRVVYLEFAGQSTTWPIANPGNATGTNDQPLSANELRKFGVFWGTTAFVTRMRVRYTERTFPADFQFQETGDSLAFQTRYTVRIPWDGSGNNQCAAADTYRRDVRARQEQESQTLARLTGWNINDIREKQRTVPPGQKGDRDGSKWWDKLWGN